MLFSLISAALAFLLPGSEPQQRPKENGEGRRVLATYRVPFRLSETQHILVRAKLNGKGPYNFIVDTGAPMLFVSTEVAKKIGVTPDATKVGVFERLELEGGTILKNISGRIENPMQLRGMNAMGLAGAQLDGILGYNVLARFRMEIDLTQTAMIWHLLDYEPEAARPLVLDENNPAQPPAGIANMERMANMMSALLARSSKTTLVQRGFIGIELAEDKSGVTVKTVLPDSPAAQAGLKAGDRITNVAQGKAEAAKVSTLAGLLERMAKVVADTTVRFSILRGGETREVSVTAGIGGF